ncbi:mechanosensitive ion channel [Alkalicoccus daliensis]|uniref:Conserved TM helix n=1 Tax=Alkalicoccus daliensis TaxID=745820 RepID=A0A1H0ETB1_9BACI|nr:mechanosensitive ion channel [Alkalicoccus daliensis]SDN85697.1 Conserved TM helix [Alkalicoccus daliensis]
MNDVGNEFQSLLGNLISGLGNVVVALLLLLLAWVIAVVAKKAISKGLIKAGADKGLAKTPLVQSEEQGANILKSIANVVYFLVFLLFLPSILDALNMEAVSGPITNMMETFLAFLPNIFAAAIILIVGYFVARLVKDLIFNLLESLKLDHWFNKFTNADGKESAKGSSLKLSSILANIVFILILIPVITVALEALNIEMISEPINNVFNMILSMIPNVFVAIALVLIGYYIAKFIGDLLTSLLARTGVNQVFSFFQIDGPKNNSLQPSNILGQTVKVLIILFFTVEALSVLQLSVLNNIGEAILAFLPLLISALIILLLGLFGGHYLGSLVRKYADSGFYAGLVKYTVIVFAAFMAFDQLEFASSIVNSAFLLILGALAVAFAIAFGVGGREFAKVKLQELDSKMKKESKKPGDPNAVPEAPSKSSEQPSNPTEPGKADSTLSDSGIPSEDERGPEFPGQDPSDPTPPRE